MASLLDKLKAAKPIVPKAPVADAECLTVSTPVAGDYGAQDALSKEAVYLLQGLSVPGDIPKSDMLFIDTETTGLSGGVGTVAFLVGCGRFEAEGFTVRQYLMRDYPEEASVLRHVLREMQGSRLIVSFNGASFDMPLLQNRLVMHRMHREAAFPPHIDLLHAARRVYRLRIGRCTLQALEKEVFLQERGDDLPGSLVPERFFRYMKSRDMSLLTPILEHNRQDIVSLARLTFAMAALHENPMGAAWQEDMFSLGRVMEKRGRPEAARACYRAVGRGRLLLPALTNLAQISRRACEHEAAAELLEQARRLPGAGAGTYIALAKIYEHRLKRCDRALDIARQGMVYCSERFSPERCRRDREYQDLARRVDRLLKKTGGKDHGAVDKL